MATGRVLSDPFNPQLSGASLGAAHGRITIDTSDAERARTTMQSVGRDTAQAVKPIQTAIQAANKDLSQFRGELVAISAAGGIVAKIGLTGARNIRAYAVQFRLLTGSQQQANELMQQLTEEADRFGINVYEVWQLARALLPALEGDTDQLDEFVKRAALLASTNPLKSTADAARAIQEYLAGQYISLQRLFNVNPQLIIEARNQFEGVGDQLDYILERMGATEEGALEMADAFVAVRNELTLAIATGFTPQFNKLQPIAKDFRVMIQELRDTRPAALEAGAALASIAVVGAPTLLFLNQLLTTARKLQTTGILGLLGKAGVIGGALALGAYGGVQASRAIGRATGREDMQQATLGTAWETFKQVLYTSATGWAALNSMFQSLMAKSAAILQTAFASLVDAISGFVGWLSQILPGAGLEGVAGDLKKYAEAVREAAQEQLAANIAAQRNQFYEGQQALGRVLFPELFPDRPFDTENANRPPFATGTGATGRQFSDEEIQLTEDYLQALQDVQDKARQDILDAEREFGKERAAIIEDYNRTLLREEQDWQRQQARALEDLNNDIADVRASAAEREAESAADLQQRIAELREDGAAQAVELQKDANDQLEKLQRDHRNSLLEAAARLDARAVAEEQRRYATRVDELADDLQERTEQERDNLQERIQQEQEAHEESLREQRQADDERIRDLQRYFRETQRREAEDRAVRLQRMREDHILQLQEFDATHVERISQIRRNAQLEQTELERDYRAGLLELNDYWRERLKLENTWESRALEMLADYWDAVTDMIPETFSRTSPGGREIRGGYSYQSGGYVPYTGPAMVHGSRSRPEYMIDANTTGLLERMVGGALSPGRLVSAIAGGGSGGNNMQVSFVINGAQGQSAQAIGREVERVMIDLFRGMVTA